MHRLAEFKQHVVSHINDGINAAHATSPQGFLQPQGSNYCRVNTSDHAPQITRTLIGRENSDLERVVYSWWNHRDFRMLRHQPIESCNFSCESCDPETITAIWGQIQFNTNIIKVQVFSDTLANRRIRWQLQKSIGTLGQTQFLSRTEHAV